MSHNAYRSFARRFTTQLTKKLTTEFLGHFSVSKPNFLVSRYEPFMRTLNLYCKLGVCSILDRGKKSYWCVRTQRSPHFVEAWIGGLILLICFEQI